MGLKAKHAVASVQFLKNEFADSFNDLGNRLGAQVEEYDKMARAVNQGNQPGSIQDVSVKFLG